MIILHLVEDTTKDSKREKPGVFKRVDKSKIHLICIIKRKPKNPPHRKNLYIPSCHIYFVLFVQKMY